jgi:aspartyl protease family protein
VFGTQQGSASLVYSIILVVLATSSLILGWRGSASLALRHGIVWLAIGLALVVGYSYRNDLAPIWQRVAGEVNPAMPVQRSGSEVTLRKASDGHFYADADINGTSIRMLADTGASMVVLSESDAQRAGIDTDGLDFTLPVSTANGETSAAEITLDEVRVGSIVRRDVRAAVARGLAGSLLGMSFFSSLSKFAIESDELVLRD